MTSFKTVEEVNRWMDEYCNRAIQPGLRRIEWLLERLQHPERRCKFVHIAGTNGKGSTAAMIAAVLTEAGYKTGLYVSPAVVSWNERIQINGTYILEADFIKWSNHLRPLVEEMRPLIGSPSPFEFYTVLALCYFAFDTYPEVVVWETGLGGRWDATNVVIPLVSVITKIGMDHQEYLGLTLDEIAKEKAGIIKPGIPVVCGKQQKEITYILKEQAYQVNSSFYEWGKEFATHSHVSTETFSFESIFRCFPSLSTALKGAHQRENAGTALMTLEVLKHHYAMKINETQIERGLSKVIWPGRIEKLSNQPILLLDGAHNEDGMKVLVDTLQNNFTYHKLFVLLAVMKEKNVKKMLSLLLPLVEKMITTEVPGQERSYSAQSLAEWVRVQKDIEVVPVPSPQKGMGVLQKWAGKNDIILVTGSLFLVSEVRTGYMKMKKNG